MCALHTALAGGHLEDSSEVSTCTGSGSKSEKSDSVTPADCILSVCLIGVRADLGGAGIDGSVTKPSPMDAGSSGIETYSAVAMDSKRMRCDASSGTVICIASEVN